MVKFGYALDSRGTLVRADSLVSNNDGAPFRCVACGDQVIAKTEGKVRRPHFSHIEPSHSDGESYLHALAKHIFAVTYQTCLTEGRPFEITLDTREYCSNLIEFTRRECLIDRKSVTWDLTEFYTEIEVEKRFGHFVPDVCLSAPSHPGQEIFVEVAVHHFLSQKKEHSGKRIIEIHLDQESDIEFIRSAMISKDKARFLNFNPKPSKHPNSRCRCSKHMCIVFMAFHSGKYILKEMELGMVAAERNRRADSLAHFEVLNPNSLEDPESPYSAEDYCRLVRKAWSMDALGRDCHVCRYHGHNSRQRQNGHIYCKTYKKVCHSTEAKDCDRFRLDNDHF